MENAAARKNFVSELYAQAVNLEKNSFLTSLLRRSKHCFIKMEQFIYMTLREIAAELQKYGCVTTAQNLSRFLKKKQSPQP